ncbi:type 1 glutamine amidotransferase [Desulfobacter curvatus]|uniref:type 1 glutamine amidotransferase n=1 Tax=Desulfobacter curvatus TaxID=2290 RepID=UPI000380B6EB|nr:type 1 glutamine amidotransferase [Desulfobacter curvatus]
MKIHYLQHVPFEDLGMMAPVLMTGGHQLTNTQFFKSCTLPSINDFDCLIVMGGPMGVNDESSFPWLHEEKKLIEQAVRHKKNILGICLGAQLIAQVMGADVHKNKYREIGWFDIETDRAINDTVLAGVFPQQARVFHWHGDTFDIPKGAVHIAKSEACLNQGFIFDDHIIGFQFHLESTQQTVENLVLNCKDEIDGSKYVQSETEILSMESNFSHINNIMHGVLDSLIQ